MNDEDMFEKAAPFYDDLIKQQVSSPPEFEKTFQENFWELLA